MAMAMQYRRLGRTGLRVSIVGLGTGGSSQLGQGSGVSVEDAITVVRRTLDTGINLIDTAADYRESEAILGQALDGVPRDSYVLCTKFNPVGNLDWAARSAAEAMEPPEALAESVERSLRRLRTDYLDVLQLHGVTPDWYDRVRERMVPAGRRLQEQGKVRFLGITERFGIDREHATLTRALTDGDFDTLMVGYNLLSPSPEAHVLPEAQRHDAGVLVMCAVRRAISRPAQLAALIAGLKQEGLIPQHALPAQDPLGWLVGGDVESLIAAAYKYAVQPPAVSCVLTGTANLLHLEQNIRAILGPSLPHADHARLVSLFGPIGRNMGN